MLEPIFLTLPEVISIHDEEITISGGLNGIRDLKGLESSIGVPQSSFDGQFLNDIFGMAASYITSLVFNHPFLDGNKRTALASALTFLYINGYEINENYEEELADKILDLIQKNLTKEELISYLKNQSLEIQ